MDIVSYSKAMQGRKNLDSLNKRLGVGDYKNGDKDVKGTFATVKARLDELEKKRQGLIDKEIIIDTKDDFAKGTFIGLNADTGVLSLNKTESGGESNVNLIPVMTSNTAPSGVVSASAESLSNGPAYRAFNGTTNSWEDRWFVEDFVSDTWLQYKYDSPVVVTSYEIHPVFGDNGLEETRAPRDFKFHGSNDGETWNMIGLEAAISGWKAGNPKRFFTQNRTAYQYYRLTVLANNGDKSLEIGELKMLGPSLEYTNQGEWISQEIDLGNDFLELSAIEVVGTGNIKVSTKTNSDSDFIELDGKNIKSRNGKKLKLKVQFKNGEVLPTIDSIKIKYKIRPLPNRVSDLETSIHINLNKHNLRVNSLLDKKRYNMKDMIIDDFGDNSGIDVEKSENITYDKKKHKVKQSNAQQPATFITVSEQLDMMPKLFLLSGISGKATRESGWIKYPEAPLTSNTSNSLNVIWETTVANFKGTQPWQVFDGNEELSATHAHYYYNWRNYYVGLDFKDSPKHIEKVYISSVSLVEFQVICSNDKTNWKIAYSGNHGAIEVNGSPTATPKEYEFDSIGSYRYWAIRTITSVPNNWHGTMNELAFFENKDQDIMTPDPSKSEGLEYYVSRNNGEDWMRIEKDKLVSLDKLPEGKELVVKVVLKSGEELHAISYSWL
ncbi:discoidin domain-containing protein [Bacillus toyonensis]|nr:discoidin domain-containing protein [Bacillus toyonensis]